MRRAYLIPFLISLFFSGCIYLGGDSSSQQVQDVSRYKPITIKRSELKNSISLSSVKPSNKLGKIYILNKIIFLNDTNKGFHILDNNNPKKPIKKKFLSAIGATDIAVRNNTIYINQATDLVVLNYDSNTDKLRVIKRLKNVFPQKISPDGFRYNGLKDDEIIVDWKLI